MRQRSIAYVCLALLGSLILTGCATNNGGLTDTRAGASDDSDVPGAARRNAEPSANGGWAW